MSDDVEHEAARMALDMFFQLIRPWMRRERTRYNAEQRKEGKEAFRRRIPYLDAMLKKMPVVEIAIEMTLREPQWREGWAAACREWCAERGYRLQGDPMPQAAFEVILSDPTYNPVATFMVSREDE